MECGGLCVDSIGDLLERKGQDGKRWVRLDDRWRLLAIAGVMWNKGVAFRDTCSLTSDLRMGDHYVCRVTRHPAIEIKKAFMTHSKLWRNIPPHRLG